MKTDASVAGSVDGNRPQQHGVDQAEDGGVGADAERERKRGDGGEAGLLASSRRRVTEVLKHGKKANEE